MNTNELLGVNLIILSRRTSTKIQTQSNKFCTVQMGRDSTGFVVVDNSFVCTYALPQPTNPSLSALKMASTQLPENHEDVSKTKCDPIS